VPALWGLEVANAISRAEAKGLVTESRSGAFLEMLAGIEIDVDGATFSKSLSNTLQIAQRHGLSAYDAATWISPCARGCRWPPWPRVCRRQRRNPE